MDPLKVLYLTSVPKTCLKTFTENNPSYKYPLITGPIRTNLPILKNYQFISKMTKFYQTLAVSSLFSLTNSYQINTELLDLIFEKKNLTEVVITALNGGAAGGVHMRGSAFQLPNDGGERNDVTDGVAVALENYGCWCARLSTGISPGGNPVDDIDTLCRSWAQCRHCEDYSACDGEVDAGYTRVIDIARTSI